MGDRAGSSPVIRSLFLVGNLGLYKVSRFLCVQKVSFFDYTFDYTGKMMVGNACYMEKDINKGYRSIIDLHPVAPYLISNEIVRNY